ncbi:hypothetical protein SISNIDRAFT_89601 [Sistotremastrum niveocremeum HHB9708]|uniref:Uncharacterized protein n=1 Tax=Sistotremastrum niveocremeum HHB9708 TaxID=1314777 RepID=A0A164U584_9AGAM|nr:hypothetical protein SISNIDRAFT_89601 [Sistotremastrum niveocremeum HHB9708]
MSGHSPSPVPTRDIGTSTVFVTATSTSLVFISADLPTPTTTTTLPVVATLSTVIEISRFPARTPIPGLPTYYPLADGSLITPIYNQNVISDQIHLVGMGALLMLFCRNIITSVSYLRRSNVKRRRLFYLLIASQLCGPICLATLLTSYFYAVHVNCQIIYIIATSCLEISYTFLITGILGIKAYQCLNRPRIVLFVVSAIHLCSLALFISDIPNMNSYHNLSGSCAVRGPLPRAAVAGLLIFAEAIFIWLSFVYAVWRASNYPEAQGRLSVQLSIDRALSVVSSQRGTIADGPPRRGWWDYVPDRSNPTSVGNAPRSPARPARGMITRFIMRLFGDGDIVDSPSFGRKPSLHTELPISASAMNPPYASSRWSTMSLVWPNMQKLKALMKDELGYTSVIAFACVLASAFILTGIVHNKFLGGPSIWIGANWGVISVMVLHSFSRVVKRHEREKLLQRAATWNLTTPPDGPNATTYRREPPRPTGHRNIPPSSSISTTDLEKMSDNFSSAEDNPFEDFEPAQPTDVRVSSWASDSMSFKSTYSSDALIERGGISHGLVGAVPAKKKPPGM